MLIELHLGSVYQFHNMPDISARFFCSYKRKEFKENNLVKSPTIKGRMRGVGGEMGH